MPDGQQTAGQSSLTTDRLPDAGVGPLLAAALHATHRTARRGEPAAVKIVTGKATYTVTTNRGPTSIGGSMPEPRHYGDPTGTFADKSNTFQTPPGSRDAEERAAKVRDALEEFAGVQHVGTSKYPTYDAIIAEAIRAAEADMKERCAAAAEDDKFVRWYYDDHQDNADIAAAIRALP